MTDNKTSFGDKIISDTTTPNGSLRRVKIIPRDCEQARVSILFDNTMGEYMLTMEVRPLSRSEARNLSNSLGGIITWADNESWPARDDYNMRKARERIELDELEAQV